ncbi:MAG: DUF3883 domain-containing protein [Anaerolineae bacterium]|nr:DUF3883 domain-containing protein [Anaerolineae bacterium]MBL8107177.1 DUF3883 domain-containing protein [Anaerolineales bacterium]MCC7188698.1 DUF3883 domain-containing protein [Anaerolineales bacterium]
MLKELKRYDNLGTPSYFFQLLKALNENSGAEWKLDDVNHLFYNRIVDDRKIFDGCVELAIKINLLFFQDGYLFIDKKLSDSLESETQMKDRFVEYLFKALVDDDDFHQIFNSKYLSYDIIYKSFQISNSAFGFKFSNFKQLLIDFDVIRYHPAPEIKHFIINSRFRKIFDKAVLPEIKRRKIGVDELERAMEEQQVYGEEAEKFVLAFEGKRLNGKDRIEWVAEYVANEGYDIASYNNNFDTEHNRFIEVKSYAGDKPYFYWSRNEFLVAKRRRDSYWLYLVNRDKVGNDEYVPLMLQDPYENVLNGSQWIVEVNKYKIEWSE